MNKFIKYVSSAALTLSLIACGIESESTTDRVSTDNTSNPVLVDDAVETLSAVIVWDIPTERENGEELDLSEIGGYEIAFKRIDETEYRTVVVSDHTAQAATVESLEAGSYEFKVASFDTDGVYGNYSEAIYADIGNSVSAAAVASR